MSDPGIGRDRDPQRPAGPSGTGPYPHPMRKAPQGRRRRQEAIAVAVAGAAFTILALAALLTLWLTGSEPTRPGPPGARRSTSPDRLRDRPWASRQARERDRQRAKRRPRERAPAPTEGVPSQRPATEGDRGHDQERAGDARRVFRETAPAVVRIVVVREDDGKKKQGLGSGFFVSPNGVLLTNYHVLRDADAIAIQRSEKPAVGVEAILGAAPEQDLAALKAEGGPYPYLRLGDKQAPAVGAKVWAIGNPYGLSNTLSEGVVSGMRENRAGDPVIQTSASVNPGSSGGPLVNRDGKVVGIVAGKRKSGDNVGFAIPASVADTFLQALSDDEPGLRAVGYK